MRQPLGLPEQVVTRLRPTHMRHTELYTPVEMIDHTKGRDSEGFKDEGDYAEYVQTYIMWPLPGARRVERARLVAPAAGVGAPRAPSAQDRSGSRRGQGAGWPELPTMIICRGEGGKTYQIPIAPPSADHELVGVYGSTTVCTTTLYILYSHFISFLLIFRRILMLLTLLQASVEYTRQSLELTASVMRILQRSIDLLTIYGIPVSFFNRSLKLRIICFIHNLMHQTINTALDTQHSRH